MDFEAVKLQLIDQAVRQRLVPVNDHAGMQVASLLASDFDLAYDPAGNPQLRAVSGNPVAAQLASKLVSGSYGHFFTNDNNLNQVNRTFNSEMVRQQLALGGVAITSGTRLPSAGQTSSTGVKFGM